MEVKLSAMQEVCYMAGTLQRLQHNVCPVVLNYTLDVVRHRSMKMVLISMPVTSALHFILLMQAAAAVGIKLSAKNRGHDVHAAGRRHSPQR